MDKKTKDQLLTVKNDLALKESKLPKNLESNKNIKALNEEVPSVLNKSPRKLELKLGTNKDRTPRNSPNRTIKNSPVKSMISVGGINKTSPEPKSSSEPRTSTNLNNDNNLISPLISNAPIKSQSAIKCDIQSPRKVQKPEFSKIAKPVKAIGSSFSVSKDVHKRISMIPIKQKNFTKAEPFQLSHTIKNKSTNSGIRKKSRTCVDLKSNVDDLAADIGKARPSSGRLTTHSSGMGIIELPGMQNHRIGEVPKYLNKPEKTTDNVFTSKKKTFNNLKKKLCECQSEFLQAYKTMQEAQAKNSKNIGKEQNKTEVIELVAVNTDDGKLLLVKDKDGTDYILKSDKMKLDHEIDANNNIEIEQKLQNITVSGFKLCQDFVNNISKLKIEKRDSENASDIETTSNTWHSQVAEIVTKMEEQIDDALNDQKTSIKEIIQMLIIQIPNQDNILKPTTKFVDQYEFTELKKSLDIHKIMCNKLEGNIAILNKENLLIPDLHKQMKDKQLLINSKDQEIQRLRSLNKNLDEQKHVSDAKYKGVESKLIAKEMEFKKIENEFNVASKRIKSFDDIMDEVKRDKEKLYGFVCREQEISKLYELERTKCEQLQKELEEKDKELTKAIIDFDNHKKSSILGAGDRFNEENQLWDEIKTIKLTLENTIKEKETIEMQRNNLEKALALRNNDSYKMELCKSKEEIAHLQKTNEVLRESLNKMEQTVNRKCGIINELEQKINNGSYLINTSKEVQNELNILRETDAEKRREIEHLKCEVAKCHIEIKQQEETIYMHQRLLRIRSELINSLQEKEASNRCRMDDLYSEVTKKSTQVNQSDLQMNHEISAKAEELQNLFSTLGTKQMELTRQEHIIKMLEENNDRNQRLRVKQEEKICRLENEISELKNIICMYQETKPNLDFKKINGDFLENKSINDLLVSRDLFHNERRKKRQIEIEVKKIKK